MNGRNRTQVGSDLVGRVGELEREVSSINANVAGILANQRTVLDTLGQIEARLNQPQREFPWIALSVLLLSFAVVMGSLVASYVAPVSATASKNSDLLMDLSGRLGEQARTNAAQQKELEWHKEWIGSIQAAESENRDRIARLGVKVGD